jgi:hypothetical protein
METSGMMFVGKVTKSFGKMWEFATEWQGHVGDLG